MGQIINPVDKGDFVSVSFDGNIFAVHDEDSREAERIAEGFGESSVIRESADLLSDFQEDLLAREAQFVSELSEGNAVNVGNPEDRVFPSVLDREPFAAIPASIPLGTALRALLVGFRAFTDRTVRIRFFFLCS